MNLSDSVTMIGLVSNIIGSVLLAVSLNKYLTAIHGAIAIHDMQIKSLVNRDNEILNADIGNLLTIGVKNGRNRNRIGIVLIILGFIIQIIPTLYKLV